MAKKHDCEKCKFRAKYDNRPKSLLGRIWRWHAGWCPGFKSYMSSIPDDQRMDIAKRYNLKKYAGAK